MAKDKIDRLKWRKLLESVFLEVGLLYTDILELFDDPNIDNKTLIEIIKKEKFDELILDRHSAVIASLRVMLLEFEFDKDNDNGFE
jgi:hypothetical protein